MKQHHKFLFSMLTTLVFTLGGYFILYAGVVEKSDDSPLIIDSRIFDALAAGPTRIIIRLRIPGGFQPEGNLTSLDAVLKQRRAIANAQEQILFRLTGKSFRLIRRYQTTPSLSLEIQKDALEVLQILGMLVKEVIEDSLASPLPGSRPDSNFRSSK